MQLIRLCEGAHWFDEHVLCAVLLPRIENESAVEKQKSVVAPFLCRLIGLVTAADSDRPCVSLVDFLAALLTADSSCMLAHFLTVIYFLLFSIYLFVSMHHSHCLLLF
jgi:formate-dependent nitrite reductase membrane component NrfD